MAQTKVEKSDTYERKTNENLLPFLFLCLFSTMHEHTHTYKLRVFLPLYGRTFLVSTACIGNWKCHCLCLWRKRNHSFVFGCCQLAHISLLCYQESRTELLTVQFLTVQTLLYEHKQVTALAWGCWSSFGLN